MKKASGKMMIVIAGVALAGLLMSCASTSSQKPETAAAGPKAGFLKGYYEKLQPGQKGGARMRWVKPGADFGGYNKIMLDSVVFYLADDSEK